MNKMSKFSKSTSHVKPKTSSDTKQCVIKSKLPTQDFKEEFSQRFPDGEWRDLMVDFTRYDYLQGMDKFKKIFSTPEGYFDWKKEEKLTATEKIREIVKEDVYLRESSEYGMYTERFFFVIIDRKPEKKILKKLLKLQERTEKLAYQNLTQAEKILKETEYKTQYDGLFKELPEGMQQKITEGIHIKTILMDFKSKVIGDLTVYEGEFRPEEQKKYQYFDYETKEYQYYN